EDEGEGGRPVIAVPSPLPLPPGARGWQSGRDESRPYIKIKENEEEGPNFAASVRGSPRAVEAGPAIGGAGPVAAADGRENCGRGQTYPRTCGRNSLGPPGAGLRCAPRAPQPPAGSRGGGLRPARRCGA